MTSKLLATSFSIHPFPRHGVTSKLLATSVSAQAGGCRRCVIGRQEEPTVCSRSHFTATSTAIFQYLYHEVSISINSLPYLKASVCLSLPPTPSSPPPPPPHCFALLSVSFPLQSLFVYLITDAIFSISFLS